MHLKSRPASSAGFTLLELLVVIVLIGIIAAMATLGIGTGTRQQGSRKEAERLESLLHVASEEAQMQGRQLGLTFYAHEYQFSTLDPDSNRWKPMQDAEMFERHAFTPDAVVNLEVEGHPIRLAEQPPVVAPEGAPGKTAKEGKDGKDKPDNMAAAMEDDTDKGPLPQIFILSSGEITSFVMRLNSAQGGPGFQVRVAPNGEITSVPDER